MVLYGNPNSLVGITLELRPMGPVPVTIGTGIIAVVGPSNRGPVEPTGLRSVSQIKTLYDSGDLKEGGELAFFQGAPNVYLVRVMGAGYATATAILEDSTGTTIGVVDAMSPGNWGNGLVFQIEDGDYLGTDVEIFSGDGTEGPYALDRDDLVEDTSNYVKVNNVVKTLVYSAPGLIAGTVYCNKANGSLTFFAGEGPTVSDQIRVSIKFKSRKLTLYDGVYKYEFNNIRSLEDMQAKIAESALITFTPSANKTHLPKTYTATALSGGLEGATPTTDDWETSLNALAEAVTPTTVVLTDYEVAGSSYDLVPILDGWLMYMANKFRPCLGFIPCKMNETKAKVMDLCAGYNNRLLSIVANAWDADPTLKQNIAVARAGKEAACALGESAARSYNSMNGLNGLLQIHSDEDVDVLSRSGADVIILKRGIRPYIGISTATDWQFMRTVDNRTINWIILAVKYITDQFYHERRTKVVLTSLKASLASVFEEQIELENIRAYALSVSADAIDTGRVDIDIKMENIGHIERFRVLMQVGVMPGGGFTV